MCRSNLQRIQYTKTKKCYLLGKFNINLHLKGGEIFINKIAKTAYRELSTLTKKYLEFCSSHCFEKMTTSSTRFTHRRKKFIDHVLRNFSDKPSQSGLID